jgi:peptidoglycan/xylan/chitin deacetylase (PgdA/CDA1 family)
MKRKIPLENGILLLSFDFELFWGVFDHESLSDYYLNLKRTKKIIPKILELFKSYDIHATWGIVGYLFYNSLDELISNIPQNRPKYKKKIYNSYSLLKSLRDDPNVNQIEKVLFANDLIEQINNTPHQEIGSHTFSHYYCLEEGQNIKTFENDLQKSIKVAKKRGIEMQTIILPRNQVKWNYIKVLSDYGIKAYRGIRSKVLDKPRKKENLNLILKGLKYLNSNFNFLKNNSYNLYEKDNESLINLPASKFMYWYIEGLKILDYIRLEKIKTDMRKSAKNKKVYHLWAHPHNFGNNLEQNFKFIKRIVQYYKHLEKKYNMKSRNMSEIINEYYH